MQRMIRPSCHGRDDRSRKYLIKSRMPSRNPTSAKTKHMLMPVRKPDGSLSGVISGPKWPTYILPSLRAMIAATTKNEPHKKQNRAPKTFWCEMSALKSLMACEAGPNPSSATRRTGRHDCNRDAPAGLLQRMVRPRSHVPILNSTGPRASK